MLWDDAASFKNSFVSLDHIVPTISLSRPFSRSFFPYGVTGRIVQDRGQQAGQGARRVHVEWKRGAGRDLFVLRCLVVANDAPETQGLDQRGMRSADLGRLDVRGGVGEQFPVSLAVDRAGKEHARIRRRADPRYGV